MLRETLESGLGTEGGRKFLPIKPKPKSDATGPGCSKPTVSTPAGTARDRDPGKHCLASCPLPLAQGAHQCGISTKKTQKIHPTSRSCSPGRASVPHPPPSTSCVAVPHAGNCFNQRRKNPQNTGFKSTRKGDRFSCSSKGLFKY